MTTAWALVYCLDSGLRYVFADTVRRTRRESIAAYIAAYADIETGRREWRRVRRAGCVACVRVEVREVEE